MNTPSVSFDTYHVEGDITVFLNPKGQSEMGFAKKEFISVLSVLEKEVGNLGFGIESPAQYTAEIENGINDIEPDDTDSIIVNGKTIYPSSDEKVWLFPIEEGRITLYSAHPEYEFAVQYKKTAAEAEELPSKLWISNDTVTSFGILAVEKTPLADSLARYPRLFAEYEKSPIETIKKFNSLPETALLNIEDGFYISPKALKIFENPGRTKLSSINKLVDYDTTNAFTTTLLANKYLEDDETKALELLHRASQNSHFEDYYIEYLFGIIYESQKEYEKALDSFSNSIKYSADLADNSDIKRLHKKLYKKIDKLYKKI